MLAQMKLVEDTYETDEIRKRKFKENKKSSSKTTRSRSRQTIRQLWISTSGKSEILSGASRGLPQVQNEKSFR